MARLSWDLLFSVFLTRYTFQLTFSLEDDQTSVDSSRFIISTSCFAPFPYFLLVEFVVLSGFLHWRSSFSSKCNRETTCVSIFAFQIRQSCWYDEIAALSAFLLHLEQNLLLLETSKSTFEDSESTQAIFQNKGI
jgi:hypothetical protein